MQDFWENRSVLVTGGASFIGSHLVDSLVEYGAKVKVIDNFSSGKIENLNKSLDKIDIVKLDLETNDRKKVEREFKDIDIVFHLAAKHGGRGYIDSHPADVCSNMAIDNAVLNSANKMDVKKVIMASSACAYPPKLQQKSTQYKLKESDTDLSDLSEPLSADIEYGWAKVMGEMQLRAFYKQYGLKGASMRFVTAYGPRENETHAIIALIYKALNKQDPYEVWGDGNQDRDFTYVKDITSACIMAAEKVKEVDEFNVGTGERYNINDIIKLIFKMTGFEPSRIKYRNDMPTGVYSRALDISKIREKLGWVPKYTLTMGLKETIEWYKNFGDLSGVNTKKLLERS